MGYLGPFNVLATSKGHAIADGLDPLLRRDVGKVEVATLPCHQSAASRAYPHSRDEYALGLRAQSSADASTAIGQRLAPVSPGVRC